MVSPSPGAVIPPSAESSRVNLHEIHCASPAVSRSCGAFDSSRVVNAPCSLAAHQGNPIVGAVLEYRHGAPAGQELNNVSINGFENAPFNGTRNTYFFDGAFRPGCDEGLLVGGESARNPMVIRFRIEGGRVCNGN